MPGCPDNKILFSGAKYLWLLSIELALCNPSKAQNIEVIPRFLENLCTLELMYLRMSHTTLNFLAHLSSTYQISNTHHWLSPLHWKINTHYTQPWSSQYILQEQRVPNRSHNTDCPITEIARLVALLLYYCWKAAKMSH